MAAVTTFDLTEQIKYLVLTPQWTLTKELVAIYSNELMAKCVGYTLEEENDRKRAVIIAQCKALNDFLKRVEDLPAQQELMNQNSNPLQGN
jgi:hypothetical protein